MEKQNIYTMALHAKIVTPEHIVIWRVPGGWIYKFWDYEHHTYYPEAVFVPYISKEPDFNYGK